MKIDQKIKADGRIGTLEWMDNHWNNTDGTPADILCRVIFKDDKPGQRHFYRLSQITEITEIEEQMEDKVTEQTIVSKPQIEFSEFLEIEKKLEIKIGTINFVEDVLKSDKLIKLSVNFGEDEERTVVTNIKPFLTLPQELVGQSFAFITNLKPVKMMGIISTAMIMPGEIEKEEFIFSNGTPGTKLL